MKKVKKVKKSSNKKKISRITTFHLAVLGFLLLSFALGIVTLMSGNFDLRPQAQVPYSPTPTRTPTKSPTPSKTPTKTPTKSPTPTRTPTRVPTVSPVPLGTCVNNNGKTSCQLAGYYPATSCSSTCTGSLICCGGKILNQVCVPNTLYCGLHTYPDVYVSGLCNDIGTAWVTTTVCAKGQVCSSAKLCVWP